MGTDRLTSFAMDFSATDSRGADNSLSEWGHSIGTCSTQAFPYQRVQIVGTEGRIEIEIPFNAPPDRSCRIFVGDETSLSGKGIEVVEFPICDQYTIQGDLFSLAIQGRGEQALPLEDSIDNMAVIEAIFRSAETNAWETP